MAGRGAPTPTQAITKGIKELGIPEWLGLDAPDLIPDRPGLDAPDLTPDRLGLDAPGQTSQLSTKVPAKSPSVHTVNAACGQVSVINLVSGLTYFDLVEDEHSTSNIINIEIEFSILMGNTPIPKF